MRKLLISLSFLAIMFNLKSQVLIDANGTHIGSVTALPPLTTPFMSVPNQTASNYWPLHV